MRKYIGSFQFNSNLTLPNKNCKYVEATIDAGDYKEFYFEDISCYVFIDGEIYDYKYKVTMNNENFINKICQLVIKNDFSILSELNGSFNLVIFNEAENQICIINDRFATRPLYFYKNDDVFLFSNRASLVAEKMPVKKTINIESVREFFHLQMIFGKKTFVNEVNAVAPSTYNIISEKGIDSMKYWEFRHNNKKKKSKKLIAKELSEIMENIISYKTNDDKRFGILLSGGLDSRAILAADQKKKITHAFTLGDSYNIECTVAEKIAKEHGAKFNFIQRDANHYYRILDESVDIGDGMHNYLNAHFINYTHEMKKNVDIVFNGSLIEQFWQGTKFIKKDFKILNKSMPSPFLVSEQENDISKIYDNFPRKVHNSSQIFIDRNNSEDKNSSISTFRKKLNENFENQEVGLQEAIDYLASDSYGRYSSHLNQLCINNDLTYRTIYDNNLIDFLLEIPIKYRSNGKILKEAMQLINPTMTNIPLASSKIKLKRNRYMHWVANSTSIVYYKFFQSKDYKSKNSSWPNYANLLIENGDLKREVKRYIDNSEKFEGCEFNKSQLEDVYAKHMNQQKNNERILFQFLTFCRWYENNFNVNLDS